MCGSVVAILTGRS